jgi:tetratricopeptide (TPR) repeat protein
MRFTLLRTILISTALLVVVENSGAVRVIPQEDAAAQRMDARKWLNEGVQAYREGQIDQAIVDFQNAKKLDPSLVNAQLYLATARSAQYIPGDPSPENAQHGDQALQEFRSILGAHPDNLSAIDGAGSILYNLAGTPFDPEKMEESKSYHQKHIELRPGDPEPYYWVGVIDWSLAFRGNGDMRADFNKIAKKPVKNTDPTPPALAAQFRQKYGGIVDEGIANMNKAMDLRPDYDDAMAYLNLLYRQKADMELTVAEQELDVKIADDLVDQVKAIKKRKMSTSQSPPP